MKSLNETHPARSRKMNVKGVCGMDSCHQLTSLGLQGREIFSICLIPSLKYSDVIRNAEGLCFVP